MPLPSTVTIVRSACSADHTISAAHEKQIIEALRNPCTSTDVASSSVPRLLRRREVAKLLNVNQRTVDNLSASGALPRVKLPGRSRSVGFREADVIALIQEGR